MPTPAAPMPLFVDLDGTVIKSDLLFESVLWLLRHRPWTLLLLPFWLLRGRAYLKYAVANHACPELDHQPRNPEFEAYLHDEAARGRDLILISASDERLVRRVADQLGCFVDAIGSDAHTNLKGAAKLLRIQHLCGERRFAYAGDSHADLVVWQAAAQIISVNATPGVRSEINSLPAENASLAPLHFDKPASRGRAFWRALRPHQWLKNGLLFLPLLLSHQLGNFDLLLAACIGFTSFSLCASSVYLLNDMLDLESDRAHTSKHTRPFAAGDLSLRIGFVAAPLLLLAAFAIAASLKTEFIAVLALYWVATLLYSLVLKAIFLLDAVVLAGLFTARIIAGSAAIGVVTTDWLLAFSLCMFFGLALVKRYAELMNLQKRGKSASTGRGYRVEHLTLLRRLGLVSNSVAVAVFALYALAPSTVQLYSEPFLLLPACLGILYLVLRLWSIARAGELEEDPVRFAMRDHRSQLVLIACALVIWLAI
ncbi:MAG: UbiA family prenyltransferase [Gammaproteobacteria bacterium]|jgi:4-hydroxybenzoate polyprenyltransferase|nr:UbiA family prenyltransferase [Gammaproteobacteria bacterium]